ncbi:MAG: MOSC domain-containing protein [Chloroflexi bacterium]|nr:MOSC domain-containing protein [Chloroflexota bacterium]MBP7042471.1 MOSC domain-containing protein [Chloroflexota bacterium]
MTENFQDVGVVKALYRYPVKSMQGETLAAAQVVWHGLEGDRRYAFMRGDVGDSSFPWLTGRQIPAMLLYTPQFTSPDDARNSAIVVRTPDGRSLPITSPELLAELADLYGRDVRLIHIGRGVFDSLPLSVMSTATAVALNADVRRFRQNIVIETVDGRPFVEESWLDRALHFSSGGRIRLNRRIPRCVMVNVDPDTAVTHPALLRTVAQTRDNCVGVHASTEQPGLIRVGDVVRVAG